MNFNEIIIERKLREFLEEDCSFSDISSESIIEDDSERTAHILAKSSGYISGLRELEIIYTILGVGIKLLKKDGEKVSKGEYIAKLNGNPLSILLGERTALNLLTHMSAITTSTRTYIECVKKVGKKVKIACTRKTLPGLRIFEKKAVLLGGGESHRFSLDDMVLLKDTHLKYYDGKIDVLLNRAKDKVSFTKKIEIEIESVSDVIPAVLNKADIIMLDNMTPNQVKDAITLLKKEGLRDNVIIEVSGGITIDNVIDYIMVEPDIISSSELTQFPPKKLDLSLRLD